MKHKACRKTLFSFGFKKKNPVTGTPCYDGSVQNLVENACQEAEIYKDSQVVSYTMHFLLFIM
jgi:hypothetical protein